MITSAAMQGGGWAKERDGGQQLVGFPWWNPSERLLRMGSSDQQLHEGDEEDEGCRKIGSSNFTVFPDDMEKEKTKVEAHPQKNSSCGQSQGCQLTFEDTISKVSAKYPYIDNCYGVLSSYAPQITGRVMLPFNMKTNDSPIYVNAKQYNGIMRRRQCRAKAEMENRILKARKPYMHESRHLHALRRPRGCGGRFLNTAKLGSPSGGRNKAAEEASMTTVESQTSEVLQSSVKRSFSATSTAKMGGSTHPGSEDTDVASQAVHSIPGEHEWISCTSLLQPLVFDGSG